MGFLAPWFLIGVAGLGAPLYLHLLRRQTTTPRPFSSLMFFEPRTQSSMRHRRLRYLWLLALRLALLALLVLAFANPYLLRPAASVTSNRLTAIVLDRSFSMRAGQRFLTAQRQALATLAGVRGPAQVMALGSRLEVLTQPSSDHAVLRGAIADLTPGYGRADLGELARGMKQVSETTPTPVTLDFFSDLQQSSLPASFRDALLPANVTLVLHPSVEAAVPNWTVELVRAPTELWGSPKQTQPARVEAVIAGYGTPAAPRRVSLHVNGKVVGTQTVAVPASGRATVVFDAVVFPYGWSRGAVRLEDDAFSGDNEALFTVRRSDPQRVLFVHAAGDQRSPLYFGAALGAGRGNAAAGGGGSDANAAFLLDSVSAGTTSDGRFQSLQGLSGYALVVLSDVPALPTGFERALAEYVRGGGGLLVATGVATHSLPVFGGAILASQNYGERALAVSFSDASHPSTALLGDWPDARFFFADRIAPGGAEVVARLSDQTPLLLDKRVGEGRVEVFASGFDNLTNNFPLQPGFVPFVRETAAYLAGDAANGGGGRAVDSYLTLRTAKEQGVGVEVTDPEGQHPLSLAQSVTAQALQLKLAGFYQLRLANGRQQVVAVNPDRRESDLSVIPAETLALWRGAPTAPAPGRTAAPTATPPAKVPVSLWWYVMLLLLAAAVIESVVAARYLSVRRDPEEDPVELKKEYV